MIPSLLLIFPHSCEIKSGSGLRTRLHPLYLVTITLVTGFASLIAEIHGRDDGY